MFRENDINKKDIFKKLLKKMNPYYDVINLILSISIIPLSAFYLIQNTKHYLTILLIIIGLIGFTIHMFKDKIPLQFKILLTCIFIYIFMIQSFVNNGFIGSGVIALALLVNLIIIFFSSSWSIILTSIVLLTFSIIAFLVNVDTINSANHIKNIADYKFEWYAQIFTNFIYITAIFVSINTMKQLE